jgi:EAL domain-containing protein (putative c-di-GMP-specific phosphodiesterase class I)
MDALTSQSDGSMTVDDCLATVPGHESARVVDLALADGGLRTVFQPIVDLRTRERVGFEALTRGPRRTPYERPDLLFAAARDARRLAELDWACRCQAFRTAAAAELRPPTRLFVNAEPQTIGTACPEHLLRDWVSAHRRLRVVVEVTERDLCDAPGDLLRVAATLHELGWEVALDDVGANDAGVALLPVLRPDIVKLDMGLLAPRLTTGQRGVLRAVEAYVSATGAAVVAEGIESEAHLRRARSLGADWGQRWLLGRPAPLAPAVRSGAVGKPARVAARPGVDARVRADPYRVLATAQDRRQQPACSLSTDALLAELRRTCEGALALSGGSLVLVVLGASVAVPAGLPSLLARLRDVCALVVLLTHEDAGSGAAVRTTVLDDGDPLLQDAAVVLLSPERALALHARAQPDGSWACRRTADPHEVGESARMLLTRAAAVERDAVLALG